MAENDADPAPEQGLDQRVSSLETGQESMSQKLDKLLGIVGADGDGGDGGGHEPEGTGTNIAHEIRTQLDARDAAAKKKADEDALKNTVGEVQAKVAELAEKAPEPMPRRVERVMGWR
jgi:hypothetical protein